LVYGKRPLRISLPTSLITIANTIAPSSLQQITSLSMIWPLTGLPHRSMLDLGYYQAPDYEIEAMKVWGVVASMKGLRELNVELNVAGLWRKSWIGWEDVLLKHLADAGGMRFDGTEAINADENENREAMPFYTSRAPDCYSDEEKEKILTMWVPWERRDLSTSGESAKGDWETRLGCKVIWK
jgi:hypothetical protein